ncbi:serine/threonine-protein kinase DDB_G0283821 [Bactrocera tryoni]|uniref:serine/threonine-protein kinase DDB_G0283821 n=1 Tax=Bactrocera tryoni TaxID=59916 RepID=UPI001A976211|nr:serine/threonine-protein kinase DDB_G0283821 [Bactrocera tryoni]XP_039953113.1 serine/threonine-protein kinase DDB_G0283821 [Bactrocera tryoni]
MWILSVLVILPKTLLELTTPHCNSATKFKAKLVRHQLSAEIVAAKTPAKTTFVAALAPSSSSRYKKNNNNNSSSSSSVAETTVAFNPKQYSSQLIVECVPIAFLVSTSLSPSTVSPLFIDIVFIFIASLINLRVQHFHHNAVKSKLVFLMNDFRIKSLYKPTTTTTATVATDSGTELTVILSKILRAIRTVLENNNNNNNSSNSNNIIKSIIETTTTALTNQIPRISKAIPEAPLYSLLPSVNNQNNITVAAFVQLRLFNNNSFSSNNHRTYNNGSKSNKVFLHYTPRDPRLRSASENQEIFINKHQFDSVSELKITEDLCAYGEVIGGTSAIIIQIISANLPIHCDCNKIINCCKHTCNINKNNNSKFESESASASASNNLNISDHSRSKTISAVNSHKLIYKKIQRQTHNPTAESPEVENKFLWNSQLELQKFNSLKCTVGILL